MYSRSRSFCNGDVKNWQFLRLNPAQRKSPRINDLALLLILEINELLKTARHFEVVPVAAVLQKARMLEDDDAALIPLQADSPQTPRPPEMPAVSSNREGGEIE